MSKQPSKLYKRFYKRCSRRGVAVRDRNKALDELERQENFNRNNAKRFSQASVFYRSLLRDIIVPDIKKWKHDWFCNNTPVNDRFKCELSGKYYYNNQLEADHYEPKFRDLTKAFAEQYDLDITWDLFKPIKNNSSHNEPKEQEKPVTDDSDINSILKNLVIKGDNNIPLGMNDKQYTNKVLNDIQDRKQYLKATAFDDKSTKYLKEFLDPTIPDKWIQFHRNNANLRMIYYKINQKVINNYSLADS